MLVPVVSPNSSTTAAHLISLSALCASVLAHKHSNTIGSMVQETMHCDKALHKHCIHDQNIVDCTDNKQLLLQHICVLSALNPGSAAHAILSLLTVTLTQSAIGLA